MAGTYRVTHKGCNCKDDLKLKLNYNLFVTHSLISQKKKKQV